MACTTTSTPLSLNFNVLLPSPRHQHSLLLTGFSSSTRTRSRLSLRIRATVNDFLGDFGARDPFPAELASGFGEKVLGAGDTEHKILIPNVSALSLAQQDCSPVSPLQPPMSMDDAKPLLKKVILQIPIFYK